MIQEILLVIIAIIWLIAASIFDIKTREIPDWIRNSAGWWSERLISDEEFANGLQYLIENGIISV